MVSAAHTETGSKLRSREIDKKILKLQKRNRGDRNEEFSRELPVFFLFSFPHPNSRFPREIIDFIFLCSRPKLWNVFRLILGGKLY